MPRALFLFCAAVMGYAQTVSFEVASVRRVPAIAPMPQGSPGGGMLPAPPPPAIRPSPNGITIDNGNLLLCLAWAYDFRPWQVSGPDWIRDNRYVISARTGAPVSVGQLKPMLAKLLEERFGLVIRREKKERPVMALVVAPGGHKLKAGGATVEPEFSPIPGGGLKLVAHGSDFAILEQILSMPLWPPVVNRSGLTGPFEFTYERPPFDPANRDSWLADIQASLRKQLGLVLAQQRAEVETITIERGNPAPVEN